MLTPPENHHATHVRWTGFYDLSRDPSGHLTLPLPFLLVKEASQLHCVMSEEGEPSELYPLKRRIRQSDWKFLDSEGCKNKNKGWVGQK